MAHQSTPIRGQKRRGDDLDLEEGDDDPTPVQQHRQRTRPTPKKPKSDSKTRDYLLKLETPVYIQQWDTESLAAASPSAFQQIKHLYQQIQESNEWRRGIVPAEICEQFTTAYKKTHLMGPPPHCFRQPNLSAGSDGLTPADYAKAEFILLRKVLREAKRSKMYQRNECGWNATVYAPLLNQVFQDQDEQAEAEAEAEAEKPSVRAEAIMTATMEGDSIPLKRSTDAASSAGLNIDLLSEFCVTVTASSTSSAFSGVFEGIGSPRRNLTQLHSRSDTKIVDYGLVMDVPKNSALQEAITDLATRVSLKGGRRHINQTAYQSIQDSVIAVSIETKTELSAVDPLLQLGVWTAAWYKRMSFLRRDVFATSVASVRDEEQLLRLRQLEQQRRLVPVPLITVVGHQWDLYFAFFDAATSITLHGPVKIGCTESIMEIYVLVDSLKAVREWVQSTFKAAMEDWFGVDTRAVPDGPA